MAMALFHNLYRQNIYIVTQKFFEFNTALKSAFQSLGDKMVSVRRVEFGHSYEASNSSKMRYRRQCLQSVSCSNPFYVVFFFESFLL